MNDPLEWYYEIPIISRLYLTGAILTTTACALDLVSPFSLYFNFNLIFFKGQVRVCLCVLCVSKSCVYLCAVRVRHLCYLSACASMAKLTCCVWCRCGGC